MKSILNTTHSVENGILVRSYLYSLIQFLDQLVETVDRQCDLDSFGLMLVSQFCELASHCSVYSNHKYVQ